MLIKRTVFPNNEKRTKATNKGQKEVCTAKNGLRNNIVKYL